MPTPFAIRLSPSGPYIQDSVSGGELEVGPGSPGLMWRAQGTTVTAQGLAPNPAFADIGGLVGLAWTLPQGFHYDVELNLEMDTTVPGDAVEALVQVSEDAGATWLPGALLSVTRTAATTIDGADMIHFQEVDFDRTGAAAPINMVRVQIAGTATASVFGRNSALRITQYVL